MPGGIGCRGPVRICPGFGVGSGLAGMAGAFATGAEGVGLAGAGGTEIDGGGAVTGPVNRGGAA